jgi:hypothetical protein
MVGGRHTYNARADNYIIIHTIKINMSIYQLTTKDLRAVLQVRLGSGRARVKAALMGPAYRDKYGHIQIGQ